jgi:hypothetical protein
MCGLEQEGLPYLGYWWQWWFRYGVGSEDQEGILDLEQQPESCERYCLGSKQLHKAVDCYS